VFDYIIVGAGSAGCVLAHRLSEDPTCKVVLIEAGGEESLPLSRIPGAYAQLENTHYDWGYRTVPQRHLHGRRIFQPRGKVLGGSSTINYMVYVRGNRADYDGWRDLGNDGWGYEDVLPYFVRMECNQHIQDTYHGSAGPITVCDHSERNPLSSIFIQAAQEIGIPLNSDFNGAAQEGCGYYQMTCRENARCSAADGYLFPILGRPNLNVVTQAHATRVLIEKGRAIGVEYLSLTQGLERRYAASEVLVCAGAINSPQLLMLSGVGPAAELKRLGIDIRLDLPGVGCNLQDHLASHTRCTTRVSYSLSALPAAQRLAALRDWKKRRTGPLTSNFLEAGCFLRVDSDDVFSNLQYFVQPMIAPDYPEGPRPERHGMTVSSYQTRPKSVGRITLTTANSLDKPVIDPNYLDDPYDLRAMLAGIRWNRRILAAKAFANVLGEELTPSPAAQTDAELTDYIRKTASTAWHPVGTCKMGTDAMAVVDPRLRVRGMEFLRVVDASIMPNIISGNTNAPTMMIAEKASDLIRGTHRQAAPIPGATNTQGSDRCAQVSNRS
jgi:choline dehydrogenase